MTKAINELNNKLDFFINRLVRVREFNVLDSGLLRIDGDFTAEQLTELIGMVLEGEHLQ
jgi:hypothetical protein